MITIQDFFSLLKPLIDTLLGLLRYKVFGVPVSSVAFTMFLTLVFAGFIVNINGSGLVGLGTSLFKHRSSSSRREVDDPEPDGDIIEWIRTGH